MKIISLCNKIIESSFYTLFFFVPLVFTSDNYELFEFPKMWLVFAVTLIIACFWLIKMLLQGRITIARTPLDIPIALFLLSQIISTIFSLDIHVSLWGYYSRFNGGLFSILAYIFLYYALVSNFSEVKRLLLVSLVSGAIVALWGHTSHFGYDPTCLLLRGSLDVSCWTEAFQPRVRIFSTLGQPNWLAAYLSILLPISIALAINQFQISNFKFQISKISLFTICYLLLAILFFTDLLFTKSQSGFAGTIVALAFFIGFTFYSELKTKETILKSHTAGILLIVFTVFAVIFFFAGSPIERLNILTYEGTKKAAIPTPQQFGELGGTDSGKIRMIVWRGALEIFKNNPLIGTGVETFAFAYYKYRPIEHNLTSEWDYLYNKAHNEYLNYLATTGIFGLGAYLIMIITFIIFILKRSRTNSLLVTSLLAGYLSILVSNFFGFSVVAVNLYFFLIPAFAFILAGMINPQKLFVLSMPKIILRWPAVFLIMVITFVGILTLLRFFLADKAYALGFNLDRTGQYQLAYPKLLEAVTLRSGEPVFADELALNNAILSITLSYQEESTLSGQLKDAALKISDMVIKNHPNNVVFQKTRVRTLYTLSQADPKY
ncbi:MAG: O-antigen ligase family protein, partial [bacterium]|nr:O-antigen ligase family protein [bacterium]